MKCPICGRSFTAIALNEHLDRGCDPAASAPSAPPSKGGMETWLGAAPTPDPWADAKRLTRPQYQLKSERDMRKMLEVRGTPATPYSRLDA